MLVIRIRSIARPGRSYLQVDERTLSPCVARFDPTSVVEPGRGIEALSIGLQDPGLLMVEADAKESVLAPSGRSGDRRNASDDESKRAGHRRRLLEPKTCADAGNVDNRAGNADARSAKLRRPIGAEAPAGRSCNSRGPPQCSDVRGRVACHVLLLHAVVPRRRSKGDVPSTSSNNNFVRFLLNAF